MKALMCTKVGMTSIIADDGRSIAVTLLSASPNVVVRQKSVESDGYDAVVVGYGKTKHNSKATSGMLAKANVDQNLGNFKEIKIDQNDNYELGSTLDVEFFNIGDTVDVTSDSKGKGWAGTIKRHNFKRGRKTHGGRSYRRPGSIGSMYPQKIFKGKRMAGRDGGTQTTIKNLQVALIDKDLGVIGVTGAVPGPRKGTVVLRGVTK